MICPVRVRAGAFWSRGPASWATSCLRHAVVSVLLVACSVMGAAAADASVSIPGLTPTAQAAVDKAAADIATIQTKADTESDKVRAALIVTLTKAQDKATKAGNLELAMALKAEITKQAKLMGPVPTTEEAIRKWVIGSWTVRGPGYTGTWVFHANGTCQQGATTKGKWTLKGSVVSAQWETGPKDGLTVPADLEAAQATGIADGGGTLTYARLNE